MTMSAWIKLAISIFLGVPVFLFIVLAISPTISHNLGRPMNDTQEIEAFGMDFFNCSHNGTDCENIIDFRLKASAECAYYNRIQTNNTSCWT
jgi:hypothetical protein